MPVDRRTLPPRCAVCGYYITDDPKYAGYRCICETEYMTMQQIIESRAADMAATMTALQDLERSAYELTEAQR